MTSTGSSRYLEKFVKSAASLADKKFPETYKDSGMSVPFRKRF